jgi:hypothetical protein
LKVHAMLAFFSCFNLRWYVYLFIPCTHTVVLRWS